MTGTFCFWGGIIPEFRERQPQDPGSNNEPGAPSASLYSPEDCSDIPSAILMLANINFPSPGLPGEASPAPTWDAPKRAPTTATENEKQEDQSGTGAETDGRLGGAGAAALGDRARGVFAFAAAQPAGRKGGASLFPTYTGSRRMPFHR